MADIEWILLNNSSDTMKQVFNFEKRKWKKKKKWLSKQLVKIRILRVRKTNIKSAEFYESCK